MTIIYLIDVKFMLERAVNMQEWECRDIVKGRKVKKIPAPILHDKTYNVKIIVKYVNYFEF